MGSILPVFNKHQGLLALTFSGSQRNHWNVSSSLPLRVKSFLKVFFFGCNDKNMVIIILFDCKRVIACNIVMYLLFLEDIILILNSEYTELQYIQFTFKNEAETGNLKPSVWIQGFLTLTVTEFNCSCINALACTEYHALFNTCLAMCLTFCIGKTEFCEWLRRSAFQIRLASKCVWGFACDSAMCLFFSPLYFEGFCLFVYN